MDRDNFDFRTKFKHSVFCLAGHGDGEAAWLVLGWAELVKHIAENCLSTDATAEDRAAAESMLADVERWHWSSEKVSQPYFWSFDGEAETLNVYRVNTESASTQAAIMAAV